MEESSKRVLKIAARAMRDPKSLTEAEIRSLAGSVLTQAPDTNFVVYVPEEDTESFLVEIEGDIKKGT
jgi:hypothetical protein